MGRQKNDGRGRLGGRAKGTPNKATATIRDWLEGLLAGKMADVEADIKALKTPYERLKMFERLLSYVLAKPQPLDAGKVVEAEFRELDRLLDNLPDAAIEKLATKVLQMQKEQEKGGLKLNTGCWL